MTFHACYERDESQTLVLSLLPTTSFTVASQLLLSPPSAEGVCSLQAGLRAPCSPDGLARAWVRPPSSPGRLVLCLGGILHDFFPASRSSQCSAVWSTPWPCVRLLQLVTSSHVCVSVCAEGSTGCKVTDRLIEASSHTGPQPACPPAGHLAEAARILSGKRRVSVQEATPGGSATCWGGWLSAC